MIPGEAWPRIREWIEHEITTAITNLAEGACNDIGEYKAICGRITALRDVLSIADQATRPVPRKPEEEEEFFASR